MIWEISGGVLAILAVKFGAPVVGCTADGIQPHSIADVLMKFAYTINSITYGWSSWIAEALGPACQSIASEGFTAKSAFVVFLAGVIISAAIKTVFRCLKRPEK